MAKKQVERALPYVSREYAPAGPAELQSLLVERTDVMRAAAKLYGRRFNRRQIARILLDYLAGDGQADSKGRLWSTRPIDQRMQKATRTLAAWEQQTNFRGMIYERAVAKLDLEMPAILEGVGRKAQRGRVDAARLALEVTGRHNPKGDSQAPTVIVAIDGIPRPQSAPADVEVEAVEADE